MFAAISNSTESLLTYGGWSLIVGLLLMIVVPYWRGKSDLLTAWNFALVGCAMFLGVACLEAVDPPKRVFENYISFDFPDSDYRATFVRSLFFLLCLLSFYYVLPVARKFASNRFAHSPPWSSLLYGYMLVVCMGTVLAALALGATNITFFREVFINLGHKGAVFAVTFSFYAWYRNKISPAALALFLATLAFSTLYVMQASHGRRLLLTVAMAPIAVMYWTTWRYRRPSKVLVFSVACIVLVVAAGLWYQTFRFFSRQRDQEGERSFASIVQAAQKVDFAGMAEQLEGWRWRVPQGVFPYALVMKRLVDSGQLEVRPLNSLQFALTYPIPRAVWSGKPDAIGARIVKDVLKLPQNTNWGLGVAGQAYYEGDWAALVVYAALLAFMVRLVDEPLKREPNNPFLIAVCAASSLYIVTWLRGDLGVHTVEILECFIFLLAVQFTGALLTGSRKGAYALDFGNVFARGRRGYSS